MGEIRQKLFDILVPELDVMILIFENENGKITYKSSNAEIWLNVSSPKQKVVQLSDIFGVSFEEKRMKGNLPYNEEISLPAFNTLSLQLVKIKLVVSEHPEETLLIISKEPETTKQLGFDDFINFFPEGYFETDINGRITYLNKVGCETLELCNVISKKNIRIADLVSPEEKDLITSNFRRNLNGERFLGNEYKFITSTKKVVYVEIFSKGTFDKEGKPTGIKGIAIDITNRKLEQQKYQKQTLQISLLNKLNSSESIFEFFKIAGHEMKRIFDLNMIELFVLKNEGDKKYLKCIYNNLLEDNKSIISRPIGKNYFDVEFQLGGGFWESFYEHNELVHLHNKKDITQVLHDLVKNSDSSFKHLPKIFSSLFPLSYLLIAPVVIDHKTIGHCAIERKNGFYEEELRTIQLFVHTIALFLHRKSMEQQLAESEKKYRTIFDNSPMGIYRSTPQGVLLDVNESFAKTFGFHSAIEMIQSTQNIKTQFYADQSVRDEILDSLGKEDHVVCTETIFKRVDGTVFYGITHTKAIKDDKGKVLYFDGLLEDITARKQAEERIVKDEQLLKRQNKKLKTANKELLLAKQKAEESDRLKSAFLANMSHEIRTPLNGIMGFSSLMADEELDKEKREKYSEIINSSGHQLLNIVNDILDISKIETNQISILKSKIDIDALLTELYYLFSPEAERRNLSLCLIPEGSNSPLFIKSDVTRLKQIIGNFLSNAMKFTNKGEISFGCKLVNNHIEFFVRDTGIGIEESKKQIVFDRFRQISDIYHKSNNGTGIGLAISKGLAHLLGGEIRVESEFGTGSVFSFILPID